MALGSWAVTGTGSGKEQDFEGRRFGIYISAPWVTLGKLPKIEEPQFPDLENGERHYYLLHANVLNKMDECNA